MTKPIQIRRGFTDELREQGMGPSFALTNWYRTVTVPTVVILKTVPPPMRILTDRDFNGYSRSEGRSQMP